MQIQEVINYIAAGDSAAAKEGIENVLSAKAFDALQSRKQEMAATIFGGQEQEHEEVTDDEEAYAEDVEQNEDQEQLDEVSLKLATKAMRGRIGMGQTDKSNLKNYTASGKSKEELNASRVEKKFGQKGANRVNRVYKQVD